MEDITDQSFRRVLLITGRPDVFFTEFVSSDGICSKGRERIVHRLAFEAAERPIVGQIWGRDPERCARAAELVRNLGFDGVDINMGCPVAKVVRRGACGGLIQEPELAKEIILAVQESAAPLPVSVKTRIGFDAPAVEDWIGSLLQLDLAAITLHGRTVKQQYRGIANWDEIARAVELRNATRSGTILIGNGDVISQGEIAERACRFGVDGIMVGRAVVTNVFLFSPAAPRLSEKSRVEKLQLLRSHAGLFHRTWGNGKDFRQIRKFIKSYINGFPGAAELRSQMMQATSYEQLVVCIERAAAELGAD